MDRQRPRARSSGAAVDVDQHRRGLAAAEGKHGVADSHGDRIRAGPDFLENLDVLTGAEAELEQPPTDGRAGRIAETLSIVGDRGYDAACPLTHRGQTQRWHAAIISIVMRIVCNKPSRIAAESDRPTVSGVSGRLHT